MLTLPYMQLPERYHHRPGAVTFYNSSCFISEEIPGMKTLDELMAKLEFENELNRVCNRFSLDVNTPPVRGSPSGLGSADSGVEEGAADGQEDEEDKRLIDMVLDMKQDYELFVD